MDTRPKFVIILTIIALVLGAAVFSQVLKERSGSKPTPTSVVQSSSQVSPTTAPTTKTMEKPSMIIDPKKSYYAILKTSEGEMTIELDAKAVPGTVNNFVYLARNHFYENTIFHRVIKDFMIQGGDPEGTGAGGPGYTIEDEKFEGQYMRGTVAMARTSAPNSAGSQFFIVHKDLDPRYLDHVYVIFGKVTSGLDVVDKIAMAPTTASLGGEPSKPVTPVKISSVEIIEK